MGATNIYEAGGLVRTHSEITYPDLLLGFAPLAMRFDPHIPDRGYQLMMASMRPAARGTVKITSTDPRRHPALKFNYLGNDVDRRFWVDAVHIARDLLDQPAFKELDGGETWPGPGVETDEEILDWVARTAQSNMHPTSTCRLGTDEQSVVDPLHDGGARDRGPRGGGRLRDAALPQQRHPRTHDDARREGGGPASSATARCPRARPRRSARRRRTPESEQRRRPARDRAGLRRVPGRRRVRAGARSSEAVTRQK